MPDVSRHRFSTQPQDDQTVRGRRIVDAAAICVLHKGAEQDTLQEAVIVWSQTTAADGTSLVIEAGTIIPEYDTPKDIKGVLELFEYRPK